MPASSRTPPPARPCSSRSRPWARSIRRRSRRGGPPQTRARRCPSCTTCVRAGSRTCRGRASGSATCGRGRDRAGREREGADDSEGEQDHAGDEVEPARAVEEHELDVPPGVAEAVQLRLADARVVVDRDLAHAELAPEGLEDHLRGELHPGRVEVEVARASRRTARMPQCASEIFTPKRTFRRPVRIGLPTWRLSHGIASPWIVPSKREPMTRSSPGREPLDERCEVAHRVRLVGVAHHDVVATRTARPAR